MARLKPLVVVMFAWASLLLGASLLWPQGDGYDEFMHVDMAYVYSHQPFHFYASGDLRETEMSVALQRRELRDAQPPGDHPLSNVDPKPRGDRPTLAELGPAVSVPTALPNQMVQHPPLAYWLDAVVLKAAAGLPWDVQIWLMRLLGGLLVLPLPALCYLTARRLGAVHPVALLAAVLPLSVPNLVRDSAAVTNDSLLIGSTSVLLYLLARVCGGDLRTRTAGGVGAALAVGLLTKGYALVMPPIAVVAYVATWRRHPERAGLHALVRPLLVAGVASMAGAWWWLRNLVVYGVVQPTGYDQAYIDRRWAPASAGLGGDFGSWILPFVHTLGRLMWSGIGLPYNEHYPQWLALGWLALALLGLALAWSRAGRSNASRMASVVLALAPVVLTLMLIAYASFGFWRLRATGPTAAQGRYFYHLLVPVFAVVAIGWGRLLPNRWLWRAVVAVLAAALATQGWAWIAVLRGWYGTSLGSGFAALTRWSPLPVWATVTAVVVLPIATGAAALYAISAEPAREVGPVEEPARSVGLISR